ncbi:MAG: hypothetical protein UV35_C0046G0001 [candidate division WWE3 bacterium GW2011_GWB1_42_6]|uniref:Uncharacterized protein n=1 Tax=candidate division WWE3 bacterium GW2011_GWB1_42_6 TaxID=1619115 RepID=A0A0G1D2X8_UNCKA|nr:MAG: hypothetical protein UV35_C0046G0001 [candidate division WWE3 bacterium GW2011_GWB1_42_6]
MERELQIRIALRWIFGWWLNLYGWLAGYSHCRQCKCTWNWTEHKVIYYNASSGMFPVCKMCFDHLPKQKIIRWARYLVEERWGKNWADYEKKVIESVDILKGG